MTRTPPPRRAQQYILMPMSRLVALSAAGEDFVAALTAAWDAGDAVLPVDPRLPSSARETLLAALRAGDDVEPGDALVVATSGTTGEPKGAVLTHDALASGARATNRHLRDDGDRWRRRLRRPRAGRCR